MKKRLLFIIFFVILIGIFARFYLLPWKALENDIDTPCTIKEEQFDVDSVALPRRVEVTVNASALVMMHVAKTAGTWMKSILSLLAAKLSMEMCQKLVHRSEFKPQKSADGFFASQMAPLRYLAADDASRPRCLASVELYLSAIERSIDLQRQPIAPIVLFTFIREPVSHFISSLEHMQRHRHWTSTDTLKHVLGPAVRLQKNDTTHIENNAELRVSYPLNYQVQRLGGLARAPRVVVAPSPFFFIGIVEHMNESLCLLTWQLRLDELFYRHCACHSGPFSDLDVPPARNVAAAKANADATSLQLPAPLLKWLASEGLEPSHRLYRAAYNRLRRHVAHVERVTRRRFWCTDDDDDDRLNAHFYTDSWLNRPTI